MISFSRMLYNTSSRKFIRKIVSDYVTRYGITVFEIGIYSFNKEHHLVFNINTGTVV